MKFLNRYSPAKVISREFTKPSLTDQSLKQECDIGFIVENYAKLGKSFDNTNLNYFDTTTVQDYQDAQLIIANAKSNFEMLPSKERDRFKTVENYLEFVSNPKNLKYSYEKGLIDRSSVNIEDVYPERFTVQNDKNDTLPSNPIKETVQKPSDETISSTVNEVG